MSSLSDRLREERLRLGLVQSDLGAIGGVGKQSQINYESGKRVPDGMYLSNVATAGVDVLYVVTGERRSGSPTSTEALSDVVQAAALLPSAVVQQAARGFRSEAQSADSDAFAPISAYDAELAAGDGALNESEARIGELAFRRDWLHKIGVSPTSAVLARARGDSMAPTIKSGDMVLIDRARASPPAKVRERTDTRVLPIYALLDHDGAARIKRLDLAAPGLLAILSDNPGHSPEFQPVNDISIIGRVRWWGHTARE